ncbi:MAG: hypothetical protein ACRYGH_07920 [Janthinobacterium lividum]
MNDNRLPFFAGLAGLFGFYPVLGAFTRTYLHRHLPLEMALGAAFSFLWGPMLLLLCGGVLLAVGAKWFRAVGALYLVAGMWWGWILCTADF